MRRRSAAFVLGCLAAVGCSVEDWRRAPGPDDAVALVPWFANMYDHVAVPPLKSWCAEDRLDCRQPVEGTVPITGVEPVVPPVMLAPTPANNRALGRQFPNPIATTAESIERGRDRYDINCALCHGPQGAGDGPINGPMNGIIPSLLTDRARGYTDGYLFSMIVNGSVLLMKPYRHRVRGDDRWHIVNYLRVLQGNAQ